MDPTDASTATNWQTVLIAGIGLLSTVASGVIAILLAKINSKAGRTLTSARETAVSVEKVHIAVNSERTAMLQKLEGLRAEILELSKGKAVSEEREAVAQREPK